MKGIFARGLTPYMSIAQPQNRRLLLRAVLATDGSDLEVVGSDARQAVCHEIVDSAADCNNLWSKGDYVLHISVAGDGVDEDQGQNKENRYTLACEDEIVLLLDRELVRERFYHLQLEEEERRRKALGLPTAQEDAEVLSRLTDVAKTPGGFRVYTARPDPQLELPFVHSDGDEI